MKKILSLTLVLMLAFCFVACSGDGTTDDGLIRIGFAQVGAESDWRVANTNSMKETFTEAAGYDLQLVDCQEKHENQISAVSDFIAQEVDYIIIAAVQEDGWDQVLGEAKAADIPVILMDRTINTSDDNWVAWTGGNFLQEGKDAMTWLNGFLEEEGIADQPMQILHMQGQMGSSAQLGRTKGIEEGVAANANLSILAQQSGAFNKEKGKEVMESWLATYAGEDNLILIAENDDMAYGAIEAMEAIGIAPGKDIYIVSFDSSKLALQTVIDGKINCTVECNPLLAPAVKVIIDTLEAGGTPNKQEYVVEEFFDIKNAEERLETRQF